MWRLRVVILFVQMGGVSKEMVGGYMFDRKTFRI